MNRTVTHPRRRPRAARQRITRRGVASILAMMFLILFGSLAVAMAIASQGNMRTANTHLHVLRAMGAAETGLAVAEARLAHAVSRFVVDRGKIDSDFGANLWAGSLGGLGQINILALEDGTFPSGVADAMIQLHSQDANIIVVNGVTQPVRGLAPSGLPQGVYRDSHWVMTPAVAIDQQIGRVNALGEPVPNGAAFQITYAPLANGTDVRVIVTGYDFDETRQGVPLSRTIMQDFRIVKRVSHAIMSPSRIMIGKNVTVNGSLGAAYTSVQYDNGHPVVLRSDFRGLDQDLDQKLDWFEQSLRQFDVDGDNRLRVAHPIESQGLGIDTNGDLVPDYFFEDRTGDGYVDDFDLFMRRFDTNNDGMVALSDTLRAGGPYEHLAAEFVDANGDPIDDDLAYMIDSMNPDRNNNGIYGFVDTNGNGRWDPGEEVLLDVDPRTGVFRDHALGYRDGVIDRRDQYAKVRGSLIFRVSEANWSAQQGDFREFLRGPIKPTSGRDPVTFEASPEQLPTITAANFTTSQNALKTAVQNGATFAAQVASNLGIGESQLATYEEPGTNPNAPQYYRLDPDTNGDGLPDNHLTAHFERMPFNAPTFSDWYYRPVYKNMHFKDVEIPKGTNALFVNCTFVGVTYVRTHTDNTHVNWGTYGRMRVNEPGGRPQPFVPRVPYTDATNYPDDILPASALPPNQPYYIPEDLMNTSMDKADFPKNQRPANFNQLPPPLLIDGKRVVDTKLHSNNIRFHDCLFIGSIISDTTQEFTHTRNKLQFTGATRFTHEHPDETLRLDPRYRPDIEDLEAIATSSMMLPNYSVDIGSFNSPPEQDVRLRGAIIAGVLDIRGNAEVDGALILTYEPIFGQGPMRDILGHSVGNPALFNATIGYFGPEDGDDESLDPRTLPLHEGVRIVGWDLNGDGLADLGPDQEPTPEQLANGATPVPFHGYGRIELRFNPNMGMPDGILLPLQLVPQLGTYKEGRP